MSVFIRGTLVPLVTPADKRGRVLAVEILCACQAIDLLAPLTTSQRLQHVHAHVRSIVPRLAGDRPPAPDIEAITNMIEDGSFESSCEMEVK